MVNLHVPLPDAPADDCLLRSGHADENVLIALGSRSRGAGRSFASWRRMTMPRRAPSRFGANANHDAVVQFWRSRRPTRRARPQRYRGRHAGRRSAARMADAFAEGGDDFNLLFAGKVVHEAHPSG